MNMMQIYWLIKLDAIYSVMIGIGCVGVAVAITTIILWIHGLDKADAHYRIIQDSDSPILKDRKIRGDIGRKGTFIAVPITIIIFIIAAMLPSTKEMCAIIVIPKIINAAIQNEELKKMPDVILKTANTWIQEMTPNNISSGVKEVIKEIKK